MLSQITIHFSDMYTNLYLNYYFVFVNKMLFSFCNSSIHQYSIFLLFICCLFVYYRDSEMQDPDDSAGLTDESYPICEISPLVSYAGEVNDFNALN